NGAGRKRVALRVDLFALMAGKWLQLLRLNLVAFRLARHHETGAYNRCKQQKTGDGGSHLRCVTSSASSVHSFRPIVRNGAFANQEGSDERNGRQLPRRRREVRHQLRYGARHRDLLHQQPFGAVSDHLRLLQLALCDLLRAVQVARGGMSFTGGKTEIASTVTSKKSR